MIKSDQKATAVSEHYKIIRVTCQNWQVKNVTEDYNMLFDKVQTKPLTQGEC